MPRLTIASRIFESLAEDRRAVAADWRIHVAYMRVAHSGNFVLPDVGKTNQLLKKLQAAGDIQRVGDVLTIIGTGRDTDHNGNTALLNPMWFDDNGSILCKIDEYDDDDNPVYECEKEIEVKAADMEPGKNHIHFRGTDNEGNLSNISTVEVFVFEQISENYLPMMKR